MRTVFESGNLRIEVEVVGPLDNNVYFLWDSSTRSSVMIDAANEAEKIIPLALERGCKAVLQTHSHWDHIQAVPQARAAGIPVHIHPLDKEPLGQCDGELSDGQVLNFLGFPISAIHTPGHTPGSTCFYLEDFHVLLSGDTLFPGGPGNTRFPGGSFPQIIASIRDKLFVLPEDTLVLPGHGASTTIGTEKPHLNEWIERGW